jgi:hypothetical protein
MKHQLNHGIVIYLNFLEDKKLDCTKVLYYNIIFKQQQVAKMLRKSVLLALATMSINAQAVIIVDSFRDSNGMFHQVYCISNSVNDACVAPTEVKPEPVKETPKVEVPKQIHLKCTENKPVRQLPSDVDLRTNYRH